jgi:hypothetical protein
MGVIQWAEQRTKALSIWDIGVVKTYCVLFGVVVLGVGLGYRWFTAEPR